jgi:hypothetical protein
MMVLHIVLNGFFLDFVYCVGVLKNHNVSEVGYASIDFCSPFT